MPPVPQGEAPEAPRESLLLFLLVPILSCVFSDLFPTYLHNSALIRPLEELLVYKCSTFQGELDFSTPRVPRVF